MDEIVSLVPSQQEDSGEKWHVLLEGDGPDLVQIVQVGSGEVSIETLRFIHTCRLEHITKRYAMGLDDHQLVAREPLHLEASLLCPDCNLHGFVRDGRWMLA